METLSCSICFIKYDTTERGAVVLPCGHTFCSICTKASNKNCPSCREDFIETQVKKNYIVHALLDELSTKIIIRSQETCETHKREIDRFCKSCVKLMCSVCHCLHIGGMEAIISDVNLRDEVQNTLESYKNMESTREDLNQRIDDYLELKTSQIEEKQALDLKQLNKSHEAKILKANEEKEAKIQKAEKEAKEKIKEIVAIKLQVINQARETAHNKVTEIESLTESLRKNICSQNENVLEIIRNTSQDLKQKIESLQDLTKLKKASLNECLAIYKLEEIQRAQFQDFLDLSERDLGSILTPKRFKLGEFVDCLDTANHWLNANIMKIEDNQVLVNYTGWSITWDEWFNMDSPSLLKQWKPGKEFQINNRIDVLHKWKWLEARVININSDSILVHYADLSETYDEWIPKDSKRIAEDGARSKLKNGKKNGRKM